MSLESLEKTVGGVLRVVKVSKDFEFLRILMNPKLLKALINSKTLKTLQALNTLKTIKNLKQFKHSGNFQDFQRQIVSKTVGNVKTEKLK